MQVFLVDKSNKINLFMYLKVKEDKIIIKRNMNKMKLNKKIKIVKEINKVLKQNNSNKVIVSKSLKEDKEFIDLLYSNQIEIVQGRYLFKALLNKIIDDVCIQNKLKKEESEVAVAICDANKWAIDLVEKLSSKFKLVSIVTKKANYFKNLQKKLFEENGVIVTITNNKKRALSKANIIINIDFPEEIINKYCIYDNSIMINLEENIKIKKKRFNGKIINNYKIRLKEGSNIAKELNNKEYEKFDLQDLAEVYAFNNSKELENIIIAK